MEFITKKKVRNRYFAPESSEIPFFTHMLEKQILNRKKNGESLLLLCIGTDKITGDCLGPLVGSKLIKSSFPFPVYGTLQSPVHAGNLYETLSLIRKNHSHPFILVIDAAVGPSSHIGLVSLSNSSLFPGKGIHRPLFPVGNISVTGIISEAASCCEETLPFTSLYLVDTIADFIAKGILALPFP